MLKVSKQSMVIGCYCHTYRLTRGLKQPFSHCWIILRNHNSTIVGRCLGSTNRFKPIRKGAILGLSNNSNYNNISKRSVSPGVVLIPDHIRVQLLGVHLLHSYQLQPHPYKRNTTIKKYYDNYWLKTFLPYKGIYCACYSKKICVKETADYKDHKAEMLAK